MRRLWAWGAPQVSAAWLVAAGAIGGLAVRDPHWALAGWIAVAMVAWGLTRWRPSAWGLTALVVGEMVGAWVALPWLPGAYDVAGGPGWGWLAALPTTAIWALLSRAPLAVAWALLDRRAPVWLWLPPAWILGEAWLEATAGLQIDGWLYGQWQVAPVLRALAHWGWVPTLWGCLALAAALGVAASGRWRAATAVAAVLLGVGALLPPVPERPVSALRGVGAVHMPTLAERPGRSPDGVKVLVWPEQVAIRRPWLVEGDAQPAVVRPPTMRSGMQHLYGALIRTPEGHMNAIASLAPNGRVQGVRAKRRLFPLVETPFLGVMAPGVNAMVPGRRAPWLRVDAACVGTLVCVEAFDRALVDAAKAAGARWLAIAANDELLNGHPAGHRQMLGTAVLRAVESGLPVVRASVYGRASIIAGDGRVLAWSEPGARGVLTVRSGAIAPSRSAPL